MTTTSLFRPNLGISAMFFSLCGAFWLTMWSNRISDSRPVIHTSIVLGTIFLFSAALYAYQRNKKAKAESADSPAKKRAVRAFYGANAGQWLLIGVVYHILVHSGHLEWGVPAIIFIIGLHFLPLASAYHYAADFVTGSALMLWAVGYALFAAHGPTNPVGCLGTGLILWASALYGLSVKPFYREVYFQRS